MKILVTAFALFFTHLLNATEQIPDNLIYNGKRYEWKGNTPAHDILKSFKVPDDAVITTGNYNIYIATYSIENDSLFLTDVVILTKDNEGLNLSEKSVFQIFFPLKNKIPMISYSSIQTIPYGNIVEVTKNEWTDIHHTNYLVFQFKDGAVKAVYNLSFEKYTKLKEELFKRFKRTPDYFKAKKSEAENLQSFNAYRPNKYTMDQYLQQVIFRFTKTLDEGW